MEVHMTKYCAIKCLDVKLREVQNSIISRIGLVEDSLIEGCDQASIDMH